jgi:hypothetical protein
MYDTESIWNELQKSRSRLAFVPDIGSPGIYALFLDDGELPGVNAGAHGLLYIGMTDSSLEARNHLRHKSSGFSTLRRSIGSILRTELGLLPILRSGGSSRGHFKFAQDGEDRLTGWMVEHLSFGFAVLDQDRDKIETDLIRAFKSPLNLNKWKNPQAPSIKNLRRRCAAEASLGALGPESGTI